jgi:molybdopterin synthase sulfur carrier subunit
MNQVRIRFFASIKEALKTDHLEIELPQALHTMHDLRVHLAAKSPLWAEVLGPSKQIRVAQNHEMVSMDTQIEAGAEIAFFPPVTGG